MPRFFYLLHRTLHVPYIVERVKDPKDIHAVFIGRSDKPVDHVIGIMAVPDKVLAAEQHLNGGVFQLCFECAEPVPGIVI